MPVPPVVFDSHALLKLLRDELGAEEVEKILTEAARRDERAIRRHYKDHRREPVRDAIRQDQLYRFLISS